VFDDFIPVHSKESEMCVLGSMMLSEKAISEVAQIITAEDFYQPSHKYVFQAIQTLAAKGSAADLVTVRNSLQESGSLEMCGGVPYLVEVANSTPSALNAKEYAEIVKEKSLMRSLESAGQEIIRLSRDPELSISQRVDKSLDHIVAVANNKPSAVSRSSIHDVSTRVLADVDEMFDTGIPKQGISSTFRGIDYYTGGIYPGEYWIIGAKPGMGKTAMLISMAIALAKSGVRVMIFSLEMTDEQLTIRAISQRSGVPVNVIRKPIKTDAEYNRVRDAAEELRTLPIEIIDASGMTIEGVTALVKGLHQNELPGVAMIDYLQLLKSTKQFRGETELMSHVSSSVRELAKATQVPFIGLAQLRRDDAKAPEKRPGLYDLKNTSQFEQDGHVIGFLHRDKEYQNPTVPMEFIIAKNRNGEVGTVTLGFIKQTTQVVNPAV
jgi:replicative DNA helicase